MSVFSIFYLYSCSQEDDEYYVVVAHTEQGDIPGKSKEGICWYPFAGEERNAEKFSYVIGRYFVSYVIGN